MIKRSSRATQLILSGVVVGMLLVVGALLTLKGSAKEVPPKADDDKSVVTVSPQGKALAGIETAEVRMSAIQNELHTSGQLSYSADQTVKIAPRLQGRVQSVLVKVGDRVTAGQVVAVLESVDAATAQNSSRQNDNKLRLAKQSLDRYERLFNLGTPDVTSAQATLDQAKQAADAAKTVLTQSEEQRGIGGFTEKPLEDAQNALVTARSTQAQAQADLALAQKDYDRKVKLVKYGVAAQADLDVSLDNLDKAKAGFSAAQEGSRLAKQAVDRESKAFHSGLYGRQQVDSSRAAYRQALLQQSAADRALRLAKAQILRDLEQAKSDFQAAEFDSENGHRALELLGNPGSDGSIAITSPISGVVTERDVNPGQVVDQSQMTPWQMLVISNPDVVWVEADVYEKDIAAVKVGSPVTIQVAAAPGQNFTGSVLKIAPTLDKTSRSIKVRAEIRNRAGMLRDGEYANVTLLLGAPHQGLLVPLSAVEHEGDNDFVYRAQGSKYVKSQVWLGSQQGQSIEIVRGISAGDRIAVKGAIFLGGQVSDD